MLPKLNVTLVGAGHYARDLIYPKYKASDKWNVKATISPHSSIPGVPAFKTIEEWYNAFGNPEGYDVFDLCVFAEEILYLIDDFWPAGAIKFILPKPIADDREDLNEIIEITRKNNLSVVVASQFWYDRELIEKVEEAETIEFEFGEKKDNPKYNKWNTFLPHALQIACKRNEPFKWYVPDNRPFDSFRILRINGKEEIDLRNRGDLLAVMVDGFYNYFMGYDGAAQSLREYLPIARRYLEIKEACQ